MKKAEFRGQKIDTKEWVFGSLFYAKIFTAGIEKYLPYIQVIDYERMGHDSFEVIPETVDKFTGITNNFKEELYVNDILQGAYNKWLIIGFGWHNNQYGLLVKSLKTDLVGIFDSSFLTARIIDNIHDNPEILKEWQE